MPYYIALESSIHLKSNSIDHMAYKGPEKYLYKQSSVNPSY
jgi:hypothetical protein